MSHVKPSSKNNISKDGKFGHLFAVVWCGGQGWGGRGWRSLGSFSAADGSLWPRQAVHLSGLRNEWAGLGGSFRSPTA